MLGYVLNGKYYDIPDRPAILPTASTYKQGEHDSQRQDHQFELLQPYQAGQPNEEFKEAYPTEARDVYGFIPNEGEE